MLYFINKLNFTKGEKMRKIVILLLVFIFSTLIGAKSFTKADKKEILKQFIVLQEAVKNKDEKTLTSMLVLNSKNNIDLLWDSKWNLPQGIGHETPLTEKLVVKYLDRVVKNLEFILNIKVEPDTLKITNYLKDNSTAEDRKRKYIYEEETDKYYYEDKNNKRVYLETRIWDEELEISFSDEGLDILEHTVANKLTPADVQPEGGTIYSFTFKNGELKLWSIYEND